ncbi:hypothetical protein DDB_G0271034 [Dictyostelium discoideum AX4]|uniref:EGF-like domain-containing protein n=1 Tax=Dictyostelium discoideum TaxID=44689 RepID=Q55CD0_DICDI|nr:hypothetical protein DDB_G0271034 [Dictyostelium discoideum AX4]EAL72867.1 hypothetical protein DDB_G0271034 [Dictyostelium discoideum AX4]|eukprot:XP_646551.1 hypothetical protein DDB_G0271034 [Dictyostelium discoideum AX4]
MKSITSFFLILFISIVSSLIESEYSCFYKFARDCGNLATFGDATKGYDFCYLPTLIKCNSDNVTSMQVAFNNWVENASDINFDQINIESITNYIPYYKIFSISSNKFILDGVQLKYFQNVQHFYSPTSLINLLNDGTIPQNKTLIDMSIKSNKIPDLTGFDSIQSLNLILPKTFDSSSFSNLKSFSKLSSFRLRQDSPLFCFDFINDINQLSSKSLISLSIIGCTKPLTSLYSLKNISNNPSFNFDIDGPLYYLNNNNEKFFPFNEIQPIQIFSMKGGSFKMVNIGSLFQNVATVNSVVLLSSNGIEAIFEPRIGNYPISLDISNNSITGNLDSTWCSTLIVIKNNNFTGDIPSCFYCYFDDPLIKNMITPGNQFNQVKTECTSIIPNLKIVNHEIVIYGTDLPLLTTQFKTVPNLSWYISSRGKEIKVNYDSLPSSPTQLKTIDLLIFEGKYNFTLALDQNQAPIISKVAFVSSNSVLISGSYFSYDKSLISFEVDHQPCIITSSTFYEIQCSLSASFINVASLVLSNLKIGNHSSEDILIDTSISFINLYCNENCKSVGYGICNMKDQTCVECPSNCSNQGTCNIFTNKCECFNGFANDDCSGIQCNPSANCNGNGICDTSMGKCNCDINWASSDCNTTNHYVSSVISTSTSGGVVTLLGMFGDTHNNPLIKIGELTCLPIIKINSTMIQCEIGPGKGHKAVQVTQNGITWYGNGFKYYETALPCPSQCSSHGHCDTTTGICKCDSKWSGIDCAIEIQVDSPQSNSTIDKGTGDSTLNNGETKYSILITSINEIDFNGNSIKEINLKNNWIFISNKSNDNFYYFIQYLNNTNNNDNDTTIIISTIEEVKESKQFSFADINFNVESGSIKFTTTIKNWKYSSVLNTLQLRMNTTVDKIIKNDHDDCNEDVNISIINGDDDDIDIDKVSYMTISKNGKVLYGRFLEKALSDSRPSYIQNKIIKKNENSILIGLNLPHCVDSCIVDPDFSVLVNPDFSSNCNSSDNRKKWLIPVAVVVPIVGLSIVAIIFYVLYRKNSTLIKVHLFSKVKLRNMNN